MPKSLKKMNKAQLIELLERQDNIIKVQLADLKFLWKEATALRFVLQSEFSGTFDLHEFEEDEAEIPKIPIVKPLQEKKHLKGYE